MNTNTHPIEQEELMAYLDGELRADRATSVASHMEECPDCQKLAEDLRSVSWRLMNWKAESFDAELARDTPVVFSEMSRRRWHDWFRLNGLAPWAAGFAACLIVVLGVRIIGTNANTALSQVGAGRETLKESKRLDRVDGFINPQNVPAAGPIASAGAPRDKSLDASVSGYLDTATAGLTKSSPMVIRTAALTLAVQEFDKARVGLEEILKRHRGHVGDLQAASPSGEGRTLKATLRVPSDQLDATLAELKTLGRVESESQNGEEVTAEYVDLQARLANSRNTEQRLTDVLKQRTGKLSDVLEVETEIARVRGEIESMEAQRKTMANQVAFATLIATLTEDYKPKLQAVPPSAFMQFRNAAVEGYKTMTDGVVGLLVLLLSYAPSLILLIVLLFFPARGILRRFARNEAR